MGYSIEVSMYLPKFYDVCDFANSSYFEDKECFFGNFSYSGDYYIPYMKDLKSLVILPGYLYMRFDDFYMFIVSFSLLSNEISFLYSLDDIISCPIHVDIESYDSSDFCYVVYK